MSGTGYNMTDEMANAITTALKMGETVASTGAPNANVLSDILDRKVSADERDDAWAFYQAHDLGNPEDPKQKPDADQDADAGDEPEAEEDPGTVLEAIERDDADWFWRDENQGMLYPGAISGRTYLLPYIVACGAWNVFNVARNQSSGRIHGLLTQIDVNPMILDAPEDVDIHEWLEERRRFNVAVPLVVFAETPVWPFPTIPRDTLYSRVIPTTSIPIALLSPHSEALGDLYPVQLYERQFANITRILPNLPSWDEEKDAWTGTKDVRILELLAYARQHRREVTPRI